MSWREIGSRSGAARRRCGGRWWRWGHDCGFGGTDGGSATAYESRRWERPPGPNFGPSPRLDRFAFSWPKASRVRARLVERRRLCDSERGDVPRGRRRRRGSFQMRPTCRISRPYQGSRRGFLLKRSARPLAFGQPLSSPSPRTRSWPREHREDQGPSVSGCAWCRERSYIPSRSRSSH